MATRKGFQFFSTKVENHLSNKSTKSVRELKVFRDYPDVFLDEIPGLPPEREIDFFP